MHDSKPSQIRSGSPSMLRLLLSVSRTRFILALVAGALTGASGSLMISLINQALRPEAHLVTLAWEFVAACVLLVGARNASQILMAQVGQNCTYELTMLISARIVDLPLRTFETMGGDRILAVLTDDISKVSDAVRMIPHVTYDAAMVIGCLGYQAWLSWRLFLISLAIIVTGSIAHHFTALRLSNLALTRVRAATDELFRDYHSLTDGFKELKLNRERRTEFFDHSLRGSAQSVRRNYTSAISMSGFAYSWWQAEFLALLGVILFGPFRPMQADVPALAGFVFAVHYLQMSWGDLLMEIPGLVQANIALQRIGALASPTPPPTIVPEPLPAAGLQIQLRNISHSYTDHDSKSFVLGPIDLTISPGELVFVVGGNGSGKTTLAKIFAGLYQPETGQLLLGEREILSEQLDVYRDNVSAVFSDSHLFERMRLPGDEQRARELLLRLELQHKVTIVDGCFSTVALSQGQRKRLLLLISLLEDRPICIYDEWAADQDPHFRRVFYDEILPELRQLGKIVFVITHDDRYFDLADRLLKLDYGKLTELPG